MILNPVLSSISVSFSWIMLIIAYGLYGLKTMFFIYVKFNDMLLLYFIMASMVLLIPKSMMLSLGLENRQKKSYEKMFVFCYRIISIS